MTNNTKQSFHDKWHKNKNLVFAKNLNEDSNFLRWICTHNGWENATGLRNTLQGKKHILDTGCGNGRISALLREYNDDYIREGISNLPCDEAMLACKDITNLGKALTKANLKVSVPAAPCLGIEAGEYSIQRFIYHFFAKAYWNPSLNFEDNAVINYDWYHPQNCSRHTLKEVLDWFSEAKLEITHQCVDFYGITVHGVKV